MENIIFDLGGVILNVDNQLTEDAFVAMGVKNFHEFFGHGYAASFFKEYEIGKITDQQFVAELKKLSGLSLPDEVIINAWNAMLLDFPPERIELLKELGKRYRLFLFSNTNAIHLAELQKIYRNTFNNEELDDHFEKTYYSHLLGLRKPDRESFEYIIHENKLQPEVTMFVDDALVNIEGANIVGLKGNYLKPGTTLMDLKWY